MKQLFFDKGMNYSGVIDSPPHFLLFIVLVLRNKQSLENNIDNIRAYLTKRVIETFFQVEEPGSAGSSSLVFIVVHSYNYPLEEWC